MSIPRGPYQTIAQLVRAKREASQSPVDDEPISVHSEWEAIASTLETLIKQVLSLPDNHRVWARLFDAQCEVETRLHGKLRERNK